MVSRVLGCRPVSYRLISSRLRGAFLNVTIIHVYAPTSGHDNNWVDNFCRQLQEIINTHLRRTFCLHKGIGMLKLAGMHRQTGETYVDPTSMRRLMRGVQTSRICNFNNLVPTNTLGPPQTVQKMNMTAQTENNHNQTDYPLMRMRYQSGVNAHRTRFPGADLRGDHDLVMMTFRVRLKTKRPTQTKLRFDLTLRS